MISDKIRERLAELLDDMILPDGPEDLLADPAGWREKFKRRLPLLRMAARVLIEDYKEARDELRDMERRRKRLQQEGIVFILLDNRIKKLQSEVREAQDSIATMGGGIMATLNAWQATGGTLAELAQLCCRSEKSLLMDMSGDEHALSFGDIIFTYCPDYKDPGDWMEWEVDAPLSHSVREHMRYQLIHNPTAQVAGRTALEECFPSLFEGER